MTGLQAHREVVDRALLAHGLGWEDWPVVAADPSLTPSERLSAVLVLLATRPDEPSPDAATAIITEANSDEAVYDRLGRIRQPWQQLSRARLPWTAATAATAVRCVSADGVHDDERRTALALRGAQQVCDSGRADTALLEALEACLARFDRMWEEGYGGDAVRAQIRRIIASATPPDILDLSLLVEGDAWAGPARDVARSLSADAVAPLVRLLGDLGRRKPPRKWLQAVEQALRASEARQLLRVWLQLAVDTDVVPEHPDSDLDSVPGTLFIGTNADIVRAAAWATTVLPTEVWPIPLLGALARRGSAHNGLAGFPESLALKVAGAAVDGLIARGTTADRRELTVLLQDLRRSDLRAKVEAAVA